MLWNKVYAGDEVIFFVPAMKHRGRTMLPAGSSVYLPVEKIRTTRQLVKCTVRPYGLDILSMKVDRPFTFISSINFFAEQWKQVKGGVRLAAYSISLRNLRVCWEGSSTRGEIVADFQLNRARDIDCCRMFELLLQNDAKGSKKGVDGDHEAGSDEEDGEELEYGLSLLTQEFAACTGVPEQDVGVDEAVAASLDEANPNSSLKGPFSVSESNDLENLIAELVDEDLKITHAAENDILEKAIAKKVLSPGELAPTISPLCGEGFCAEEAVVEAALNSTKLLGNSGPESEAKQETTTSSEALAVTPTATVSSGNQGQQNCFAQFCASLKKSLQAMLECCECNPKIGDNLSILRSPTDIEGVPSFSTSQRIFLAHWEIPGKTGRVARLDAQGRLVSMVCVGKNRLARNFENCTVLHPDIGLRMERNKKAERPKLADSVLRLINIFLQAEASRLQDSIDQLRQQERQVGFDLQWADVVDTDADACVYCGCDCGNQAASISAPQAEAEVTKRCPLCLLAWHDVCATRFLETVDIASLVEPFHSVLMGHGHGRSHDLESWHSLVQVTSPKFTSASHKQRPAFHTKILLQLSCGDI